jgi:hypothetical protein
MKRAHKKISFHIPRPIFGAVYSYLLNYITRKGKSQGVVAEKRRKNDKKITKKKKTIFFEKVLDN